MNDGLIGTQRRDAESGSRVALLASFRNSPLRHETLTVNPGEAALHMIRETGACIPHQQLQADMFDEHMCLPPKPAAGTELLSVAYPASPAAILQM